jgi:hypothetical protein
LVDVGLGDSLLASLFVPDLEIVVIHITHYRHDTTRLQYFSGGRVLIGASQEPHVPFRVLVATPDIAMLRSSGVRAMALR